LSPDPFHRPFVAVSSQRARIQPSPTP
jgi:hypothetical protein